MYFPAGADPQSPKALLRSPVYSNENHQPTHPAENKMQEIIGEVPMAEMSDFSTAMRSITQGTASFTLEMARYEEVPQNIAQKIIEASK